MQIKPMLAVQGREAFDSDDYLFEPKWDGYRAIAYVADSVRIQSRNLKDITESFPELQQIGRALMGTRGAVLDGEIVCIADSKPSFHALEKRQVPASYVVFDILYDGDSNIMGLPLWERKQMLVARVGEGHGVAVNMYVEGSGRALFAMACQQGFEGIVAKHKRSPYFPGKRSAHWIKIKRKLTIDCVIGGLSLDSRGRLSSLALGVYSDGRLKYIGNVGSGIGAEEARVVLGETVSSPECRFDLRIAPIPEHVLKKTLWVEPTLCCEVCFAEFTAEGRLRQPVFYRFRRDKAPQECTALSCRTEEAF